VRDPLLQKGGVINLTSTDPSTSTDPPTSTDPSTSTDPPISFPIVIIGYRVNISLQDIATLISNGNYSTSDLSSIKDVDADTIIWTGVALTSLDTIPRKYLFNLNIGIKISNQLNYNLIFTAIKNSIKNILLKDVEVAIKKITIIYPPTFPIDIIGTNLIISLKDLGTLMSVGQMNMTTASIKNVDTGVIVWTTGVGLSSTDSVKRKYLVTMSTPQSVVDSDTYTLEYTRAMQKINRILSKEIEISFKTSTGEYPVLVSPVQPTPPPIVPAVPTTFPLNILGINLIISLKDIATLVSTGKIADLASIKNIDSGVIVWTGGALTSSDTTQHKYLLTANTPTPMPMLTTYNNNFKTFSDTINAVLSKQIQMSFETSTGEYPVLAIPVQPPAINMFDIHQPYVWISGVVAILAGFFIFRGRSNDNPPS
jgi:hypothetical protein